MKALLFSNYPIILPAVIVALLNFYSHQDVITTVLNSILLLLSWYLFKINDLHTSHIFYQNKFKYSLLFLGLTPLLTYQPSTYSIQVFLLFSLFILIIYRQLGKVGYVFLFFSFLLLLIGNLLLGEIITINPVKPFYSIDREQTILFQNTGVELLIKEVINQSHLHGRVSAVVYHPILIYSYYTFSNAMSFLSLENISISVLLANIYPLVIGTYLYLKNIAKENKFILVWIILSILVIGINKSHDTLSSLYITTPILLFWMLKGYKKINLRYYWLLIVLSLFLMLSPSI